MAPGTFSSSRKKKRRIVLEDSDDSSDEEIPMKNSSPLDDDGSTARVSIKMEEEEDPPAQGIKREKVEEDPLQIPIKQEDSAMSSAQAESFSEEEEENLSDNYFEEVEEGMDVEEEEEEERFGTRSSARVAKKPKKETRRSTRRSNKVISSMQESSSDGEDESQSSLEEEFVGEETEPPVPPMAAASPTKAGTREVYRGPPTDELDDDLAWPEGWLKISRERATCTPNSRGYKPIDHQWFSPCGKTFKSKTRALAFILKQITENSNEQERNQRPIVSQRRTSRRQSEPTNRFAPESFKQYSKKTDKQTEEKKFCQKEPSTNQAGDSSQNAATPTARQITDPSQTRKQRHQSPTVRQRRSGRPSEPTNRFAPDPFTKYRKRGKQTEENGAFEKESSKPASDLCQDGTHSKKARLQGPDNLVCSKATNKEISRGPPTEDLGVGLEWPEGWLRISRECRGEQQGRNRVYHKWYSPCGKSFQSKKTAIAFVLQQIRDQSTAQAKPASRPAQHKKGNLKPSQNTDSEQNMTQRSKPITIRRQDGESQSLPNKSATAQVMDGCTVTNQNSTAKTDPPKVSPHKVSPHIIEANVQTTSSLDTDGAYTLDEELATGRIDEATYWKKKFLFLQKQNIQDRHKSQHQVQTLLQEQKEKDQYIQTLDTALIKSQRDMAALQNKYDQKQTESNKALTEKDSKINILNQTLDKNANQLQALQKESQKKDAQIDALSGVIGKKHQELQELQDKNTSQLSEKEKQLQNLQKQIHEKWTERIQQQQQQQQQMPQVKTSEALVTTTHPKPHRMHQEDETPSHSHSSRKPPGLFAHAPTRSMLFQTPPTGFYGTLAQSQLQHSIALDENKINQHRMELGLIAWFKGRRGPVFSSPKHVVNGCDEEANPRYVDAASGESLTRLEPRHASHLTLLPQLCQLPYTEHQTMRYWAPVGVKKWRKNELALLDPLQYPNQQPLASFFPETRREGQDRFFHYVGHFRCVQYEILQNTQYNERPRDALLLFEFVQFDKNVAETMRSIAAADGVSSGGQSKPQGQDENGPRKRPSVNRRLQKQQLPKRRQQDKARELNSSKKRTAQPKEQNNSEPKRQLKWTPPTVR